MLLSELHAERIAARGATERGCEPGKPPAERLDEKPTAFPLQEFRDLNPRQLEAAQEAIRKIIEGE